MCEGGHSHQHLKGSEKVEVDGKVMYRNLTRMAGAYPPRLCRRWAQIVREIGPYNGKGSMSSLEKHEFEKLLQEARHSTDRPTSQNADAPDHPNWQGEADCDPRMFKEAEEFMRKHPVVFGQFKKADIKAEYARKTCHGEKEARNEHKDRAQWREPSSCN